MRRHRQRGKSVLPRTANCYAADVNIAVHPSTLVGERRNSAVRGQVTVNEFTEMMPALDRIAAWFELDHGMITRMPPPNFPHVRIQHAIAAALRSQVAATLALLVITELGVRIGDDVVRIIDIAVFDDPGDEQHLVDGRLVRLAVEVADTTLIGDLGVKAEDYAMAGIADYWVVDVTARVVHLHAEPTPEGYARRSVVAFGAPMVAACLPEAVIFNG